MKKEKKDEFSKAEKKQHLQIVKTLKIDSLSFFFLVYSLIYIFISSLVWSGQAVFRVRATGTYGQSRRETGGALWAVSPRRVVEMQVLPVILIDDIQQLWLFLGDQDIKQP